MKIFKLRFISLRNNPLNISICLSLLIHLFTINILYKNPISNTKGDKYIPIELVNIDSFSGKGESLNKKIEQNLLKINKNNKSQKEKSEMPKKNKIFKLKDKETKIDESYEKKIKNIEKEKVILNSSDKMQFKSQRGSKSERTENNIPERGSVKGNKKIKITCLKCVSPKYPTKALRRGVEGKPLVKVWINRQGNVTKSELIKSSGNESIDEAALLAADKSKFYPIKIESTLKIEYDLKIR